METYKHIGGKSGDWGDYWLKTYNGDDDEFNDYTSGSTTIAAGGYGLQVPDGFDGATFTFTSVGNVKLSNDAGFE